MPFKDCTSALCKLYDDLSRARSAKQSALAICLDISSAYDSIWIDGLIYKLASLGIGGKMGRWIAKFLTERSVCVRWKNVYSTAGPSRRGVPQGSVLSPLLFTLFMADIFEILEAGVYILIYADDIVLYAIGDDPGHTLAKLQNCLDRLIQWCTAYHLSVSPDKSKAIDFSRHRPMEETIHLLGQPLEWCPVVKILGVWFGRALTFNHHFSYLKVKAYKRMNYVKGVATCSRGVNTYHMLKIVNALIRSLLEYASPLFLKACPSSLNTLEVIYNAALRVATGLPKCTPIPLLRREANAPSMGSRLRYLAHRFFIRQLSLPHPPFSGGAGFLSSGAEELLTLYNLDPRCLIKFSWPSCFNCSPGYRIVTDGLLFQTTSLPSRAIHQAWQAWRASESPGIIIASDASKDAVKTAIAVYNESDNLGEAFLVPHLNSVFTAEGMALLTAISRYVVTAGHYTLLTDSLSVLRALQTVSVRSPRIIMRIHSVICALLSSTQCSLSLVWCPGHMGIPPNECADSLARNGPYSTVTVNMIAPEDICSRIRDDWNMENSYVWLNGDYYSDFPHLADRGPQNFLNWTKSRQEDVWISRWRTRMWMTKHRLFKMKLSPSPLCRQCCIVETPDHILLTCVKYSAERASLFRSLGMSVSSTYSDIISTALGSRSGVEALVRFSRCINISSA